MQVKTILIAAGGTGGHVFPGLAVAENVLQKGHQVEWLGTQHGLDTQLVPKAGIQLHKVTIRGLRGKGKLGLLLAPFKILTALIESIKIIRKVKPNVILGMGGYVAGPAGIAAWLLRKPLIIHEQNAIPGKTNAILAHFATRNLVAFPNAMSKRVNPEWVGNPVRNDIYQLPEPKQRLQNRNGPVRILVFGGSQGAQAVNQIIPEVLAQFPENERPQVWHQVGQKNLEQIRQHYADKGIYVKLSSFYSTNTDRECESNISSQDDIGSNDIGVKLESFIDNMAEAYAWADIVICRAGALTVSELAAVGISSILIPFPYAVDNHQTANAQFLVNAQAAQIIQERVLNVKGLVAIIDKFSDNRQALLMMAENARKIAKPMATEMVAEICLRECQ